MYFEYVIILLIFGIRPVLYKYILPYIQVESVILISGLFYALMASVYILFMTPPSKVMNDLRVMNKQKGLYFILLCTALMGLIATYLYLFLLKDSPAFVVTALIATYPLVTAATGYLFLNEVVTFTQLIGIVIIITGLVILNLGDIDY